MRRTTPCTTNLVIYHAYLDNDVFVRTNEVFGTIIDAEAYTKVRIVMKKIQVGETERNVFSVALNGGEPITSDLAVSEDIWFLTAEDTTGAEAQGISSVSFSGSGEVDNIGMGILSNTSFTDPEGRVIEDPAVIDWLFENGFTQNDINALGLNDAGTEKLYECFLLNCSIKGANPGGALSITGFAVSNDVVSVTVQLVRQSPLGFINGVLNLHGTDDLANDFGLIDGTRLDFIDGDSIFDTFSTTDPVTQTVTVTFDNAFFTEKFFKAKIEFPIPENPEDPWEPEPEEPEEPEE